MRAASYPRAQLRAIWWTWVGDRRRNLLVVAGIASILVAGLALVVRMTGPLEGWRLYVLGWLHAGAVGTFGGVLLTSFLVGNARAIHQLRGAWGEDFTRDELRRARRRGSIWASIDSLQLEGMDIDHLVISKRGGVLALDSKYRSVAIGAEEARRILDGCARSSRSARAVVETVWRERVDRGKHRSAVRSVVVTPVVVLWGSGAASLDEDRVVDGVHVVAGERLVEWLASLEGDHVAKSRARALERDIRAFDRGVRQRMRARAGA